MGFSFILAQSCSITINAKSNLMTVWYVPCVYVVFLILYVLNKEQALYNFAKVKWSFTVAH